MHDLVCLIGANEAGKSTALDALALAQTGATVAHTDRTRGEATPDGRKIVRLRFRVDPSERALLGDIKAEVDPKSVNYLIVSKELEGGPEFDLEPRLRRDRDPRRRLLTKLERARKQKNWPSAPDENSQLVATRLDAIEDAMRSDVGSFNTRTPDHLRAFADELVEYEAHERLAQHARDVADHEAELHPTDQAADILRSCMPRFMRFTDADRNLAGEYDLSNVALRADRALLNLCRLAGLEVEALVRAVGLGETGTQQDLVNAANANLQERFAAWKQKPGVTVSIDTADLILRIHVRSGSGASMKITERSDGLRQFVALVALTAQEQQAVAPILLIDEIETHLHYDAQADLVRVLTEQDAASQVVYTTHSAACLPDDLGAVRVVEGVGEQTASRIRQHFWTDEPGLGPLLMAMGAASLVFVPLRPAVIAEGGSDLVLLPTLFAEAIGSEDVGFQVAPGASQLRPVQIAGLDLQAVKTAWVLDGDQGGRDRAQQLRGHAVPESRIILLQTETGQALDLEDLVEADTYAAAITAYARDNGCHEQFCVGDLPGEPCARHRTAVAWLDRHGVKAPSKTAVANLVLDLRNQQPLLEKRHRTLVKQLHRTIVRQLR
jgi:energy-coupling factor transporter ATP-binding protein EcfA2